MKESQYSPPRLTGKKIPWLQQGPLCTVTHSEALERPHFCTVGRGSCWKETTSGDIPASLKDFQAILHQLTFIPVLWIHKPFRTPEDCVCVCVCVCAQSCLTLCDPMDCIAHQAPLSMDFSRQEYQGWGSLVGCRLWGRTESDTTEAT